MKKLFNNDLINNNNLEKGQIENMNLDSAISNAKEESLIYSVEEANCLVDNAMANDVTSSVIKNTIIFGGTVLISALFGWMYYEFNHASTANHAGAKNSTTITTDGINEKNKIKLSSQTDDNAEFNTSELKVEKNATTFDVLNSNSNSAQQTTIANGNTSLSSTNNIKIANKNTKQLENNVAISNKQTIKSSDDKKPNSSFSNTIITQRYFDDGSAKMTLEYKNQAARITINSRGIESLFINSEEVDPSYYYLYEDLANEAFRRSKIEPLAGATHDANAKPNINAMMVGALARRGLIKEGETFSFELTPSIAILNSVSLQSDMHKDLLQVYQSAFGSSLPRGGKFIIGKQP